MKEIIVIKTNFIKCIRYTSAKTALSHPPGDLQEYKANIHNYIFKTGFYLCFIASALTPQLGERAPGKSNMDILCFIRLLFFTAWQDYCLANVSPPAPFLSVLFLGR